MASKVIPWYKKKAVSQVKTDYAYHHSKHVVKQQTERYEGEIYLLLCEAAAIVAAALPDAASVVPLQWTLQEMWFRLILGFFAVKTQNYQVFWFNFLSEYFGTHERSLIRQN